MKYTVLLSFLFATAAIAQTPPTACEQQENSCRTAPNANQAFCSSQKAACDAVCDAQENACRTAPNANQAFCSSQRAGCLPGSSSTTSGPTTTSSTAPTPTSACEQQEDSCRTAPQANQAFCSSQRAQCDDVCNAQENACRTAPNANQAFCSAQRAGCLAGSVSSSTTSAPPPISSCQAQENACRTAPNANQAYCSAQRAACDAGGNITTVPPPITTNPVGPTTIIPGNVTFTTSSVPPPFTGAANRVAGSIGAIIGMAGIALAL